MSKLVLDQAQMIQDSFEQSFKPADSFYVLEDYARMVVDERDSLLDQEFLAQWKIDKARSSVVNHFVLVNPMWLERVQVEIVKDEERVMWYGDICKSVYEFPMDTYGSGIQMVAPYGQSCGEFVRMKADQGWQICFTAPNSMIFYSIEKCRIKLHNFDGFCTGKLDVMIVPSQSSLPFEQQYVPDGKASEIRELVMNKVWRDYMTKLGKIDFGNDGNANPQPNETGNIYADLKTK